MRSTLLLVFLAAGLIGITAVSCGQATCSPANCSTGCCNASGACETGGANAACGSNGNTCVNCAQLAQICGDKVCVAPATAGGTGGGSTGGGAAGGGGGATGGGGGTTGGGTGGGSTDGGVCPRMALDCSDQSIMSLDLKANLATGLVMNAPDGTGFRSTIDSRGGGLTPTESYVYAKFTPTGLVKVDTLSDMTALDSMGWDIAFRRFIIRVNSGDSGPGCVVAQPFSTGTYDTITAVPPNYTGGADDFLTRAPECMFVDDGSGLTTSPRTALASFYAYTSCVSMTNVPFVLQTMDGRHVKLVVITYYSTEAGQTSCNTSGTTGGAIGGTMRVRWQYLD